MELNENIEGNRPKSDDPEPTTSATTFDEECSDFLDKSTPDNAN